MRTGPCRAPVPPAPQNAKQTPVRRRACGLLALLAAWLIGLVIAAPDLDRMQRLAGERYGSRASETVGAWRQLLADSENLDTESKLARINTFFNRRLRFVDDQITWGTGDYWATPLESMGKGAADCEDYSIAKYVSLLLLGVPPEQLRLIYVRAQIGGASSSVTQAHMVLGYFPTPDAEPLILDNLISDIRPAARRADLFPVFSFNSAGLWVAGSAASSGDPTARLSRWRAALERMRADGIELAR
ncbi:MAG: transglutaminase-like cysteine peptidase [Rhodocyclaceae bacterium]|nr:transglutaminase-like cysteine peptidase [Rhodocyclaceae bacterium]